jgi:chemotaxis protein methyltransferase CheR
MKESTFKRIREFIYDRSGIKLSENKQALVRARIARRMRALHIGTFEDYLEHILSNRGHDEIEHMLDAVSTNVTHFYREPAHFDIMRPVIKGWAAGGLKKLRIWSAACSSGEEPYTIAIECCETVPRGQVDIKILATDLAPSVLYTGIKGEYSHEKIKPVPRHLRPKYFIAGDDRGRQTYVVRDVLRKMIIFRQFNLSVTPYPIKNPLDIIFCRNVMIYFDRDVRARLAREFHRILKPGGYLFLGHAESITGLTPGFKCLKPSIYLREQ